MISDVVENATFETETWLNLRDRDFKNPETETGDLKLEIETSQFLHFAEFKKMSSLLSWIFFKFLAFFQTVLVVSYLQIQQTKIVELYKFYYTISLQWSKYRDETWNLRDRDSQRHRNQVSRLHHWWFAMTQIARCGLKYNAVLFYSSHTWYPVLFYSNHTWYPTTICSLVLQ